jgi:hypothetical protein
MTLIFRIHDTLPTNKSLSIFVLKSGVCIGLGMLMGWRVSGNVCRVMMEESKKKSLLGSLEGEL